MKEVDCARAYDNGNFEFVRILDDVVCAVSLVLLILDVIKRGVAASPSNAHVAHVVIVSEQHGPIIQREVEDTDVLPMRNQEVSLKTKEVRVQFEVRGNATVQDDLPLFRLSYLLADRHADSVLPLVLNLEQVFTCE